MSPLFGPGSMAGRVLLLTGARGGIGSAIARAYLSAGGSVVAADQIEPVAAPRLDAVACDVADERDVAQLLDFVGDTHGRLDDVVHAAGIAGTGTLAQTSLADWLGIMDANLTSAFLIARNSVRLLSASKGNLVFIASTNGLNGGSSLSGAAYACSKAGVINLTRYLAKEWSSRDIRVNAVAPGPVASPMLDRFNDDEKHKLAEAMLTGTLTQPEEVADACLYLLSDAARSMTGAILNISGGLVLD